MAWTDECGMPASMSTEREPARDVRARSLRAAEEGADPGRPHRGGPGALRAAGLRGHDASTRSRPPPTSRRGRSSATSRPRKRSRSGTTSARRSWGCWPLGRPRSPCSTRCATSSPTASRCSPRTDREALLARLRIVYRTPSLRARRWEFQLEMGRISGAMLAVRRGLPPDDLGSRVTAAAAFTTIEVAMDHWQQHDGRDDLGRRARCRHRPSWSTPSATDPSRHARRRRDLTEPGSGPTGSARRAEWP